MKPTTRLSRAGFSLVELLSVIVIIGMIGTVAVVSWQALLPGAQVNSEIRNLSEVLASTRSEAIARNRAFEIRYDLDQERYYVRTPYRLGGGFAAADEDNLRVLIDDTYLDSLRIESVTIGEETYAEGEVFVRFDPLGSTSAHTIVLYYPPFEQTHTLEILPLTGEVRHHEGLFRREDPREGDFD